MATAKKRGTELSCEQAAKMLGITANTLKIWRYRGQGPRYRKVGQRVTYLRRDVQAYLRSCFVAAGRPVSTLAKAQ